MKVQQNKMYASKKIYAAVVRLLQQHEGIAHCALGTKKGMHKLARCRMSVLGSTVLATPGHTVNKHAQAPRRRSRDARVLLYLSWCLVPTSQAGLRWCCV